MWSAGWAPLIAISKLYGCVCGRVDWFRSLTIQNGPKTTHHKERATRVAGSFVRPLINSSPMMIRNCR